MLYPVVSSQNRVSFGAFMGARMMLFPIFENDAANPRHGALLAALSVWYTRVTRFGDSVEKRFI